VVLGRWLRCLRRWGVPGEGDERGSALLLELAREWSALGKVSPTSSTDIGAQHVARSVLVRQLAVRQYKYSTCRRRSRRSEKLHIVREPVC
jgi:hypothetical protein